MRPSGLSGIITGHSREYEALSYMNELLERKFFPYVIKPGRYAGGEPGQIVKDPHGRVSYLHAFPDKYEIGQSYIGLQTIYHIINSDDRFLCERVFAVDNDAAGRLKQEGLPLFSLESRRPVKEFDAVGFTLTYELVYTTVLDMLDLSQIPLLSAERGDDDPIIMAGGPAVYNPEPMAPYIDLFFIGDAEEGLPEMLSILHEMPGASRSDKLQAIVERVQSVYVPAFYDDNRKPKVPFAPEKITGRIIPNLKPSFYPDRPLVPLIDTVHRHLSAEIMRGCPQGCRFCQAGPVYRPVRIRPRHEVADQIDRQWSNSGYEEITLLSLSSSDYPEIEQLATSVARKYERDRVSVGLPSLRPGTISAGLLDAVSKVRKAGLTISPEAGTERLRLFLRKDFPDAAIYDTVRIAFERGWNTIKLYFMLGLPTETEEDLIGIANIVKQIYQMGLAYPGKTTINVTLSPFVPKPHTPFQWDEIVDASTILHKIRFIQKNIRISQVNLKHPLTEMSLVQGLLGRGGRDVAPVVMSAWKKGCRFDSWNEDFRFELWKEAFEENKLDIVQHSRPIPFSAELPWSHITKGISVEHLKEERQRTSMQLRDYVPALSEKAEVGNGPEVEYGRAKKKMATRSTVAPTKNRLRIRWGKSARYRYMSHLDNLRLIERAIRRARLPVQFSQGFNPSMKLSFGPPLPLGFTSEAEFVDITLETNFMMYMLDSLRNTLPEGVTIVDAQVILGKGQSLSALLNRAAYEVDAAGVMPQADLEAALSKIVGEETFVVNRVGKNDTTQVDIRPAIFDLRTNGEKLSIVLGIGEGGYARPSEILECVFGAELSHYLSHKVHRADMFRISETGEKISAMDL